MSGQWQSRGRLVKPPKFEGYAVSTRKGGLYMVPKNKKGKLLWDHAKFIGPAPEAPLDPVESTVNLSNNQEEELYSDLIETEFTSIQQ